MAMPPARYVNVDPKYKGFPYSYAPSAGGNYTYLSDKPNPSGAGRGYVPRPAKGTSGDANSSTDRPPMSKKWTEK